MDSSYSNTMAAGQQSQDTISGGSEIVFQTQAYQKLEARIYELELRNVELDATVVRLRLDRDQRREDCRVFATKNQDLKSTNRELEEKLAAITATTASIAKDSSLIKTETGDSDNNKDPGSTQPFLFLSLPPEIRNQIYHFASLHTTRGSEQSTRLFRVNRQVSIESMQVFYSTFYFQHWIDCIFVHCVLVDTLTPWTKELITTVAFDHRIQLRVADSLETERYNDGRKKAMVTALELLPNVNKITMSLDSNGDEILDSEVPEVVQRILEFIYGLTSANNWLKYDKARSTLYVKDISTKPVSAQWMRVFEEVQEHTGSLPADYRLTSRVELKWLRDSQCRVDPSRNVSPHELSA